MSFDCAAHLGKSYVNATQFRSIFRKTKKSWIEVCWLFHPYQNFWLSDLDSDLWPTYLKTFTYAINFELIGDRASIFHIDIPCDKAFLFQQKFLTCDLDCDLWPLYLKTVHFATAFTVRVLFFICTFFVMRPSNYTRIFYLLTFTMNFDIYTVYRDIFASGKFRKNNPLKACLFLAVSIFRYFIKERNHCVNFSLFLKRKKFRFDQKHLFIYYNVLYSWRIKFLLLKFKSYRQWDIQFTVYTHLLTTSIIPASLKPLTIMSGLPRK